MTVFNVASNLPEHWHTGGKPHRNEVEEAEGLEFEDRLRAKRIELVTGYADALCEEIEAQLHYNEHKNEKKSNPPAFYEARDRLFAARHIVKAYHDDTATTVTLVRMVTEESKQEALAKFASPTEAFKEWLLKEVQLYATALQHPERVSRLCSPDTDVYTKRHTILVQAHHTYTADGLDAAFKLWTEELEKRYTGIRGDDISTFQEIEGRSRHSGQKTGYWIPGERAMRPILVNDPATIKRNQAWIDDEPARRERDRQAYDEKVRRIIPLKRIV